MCNNIIACLQLDNIKSDCDALGQEIEKLNEYIKDLEESLKEEKQANDELEAENDKLKEENDKLKVKFGYNDKYSFQEKQIHYLFMNLKDHIRSIPDFPKKGIVFKDITPILKDAELSGKIIHELANNRKHRRSIN